jgi:hypothetical protein
MGIIA